MSKVPVIVVDDRGAISRREAVSEPWELGGGHRVIKVSGISGGYSLDRVYVPAELYFNVLNELQAWERAAADVKAETNHE